ncbi:hypothetical protein B0H14DRAFT_2607715 [Mycena olivaceomarginata]|nr:hypothetical protein B0H14DRAFT_2607715 [Mycena olivaceomarginata]
MHHQQRSFSIVHTLPAAGSKHTHAHRAQSTRRVEVGGSWVKPAHVLENPACGVHAGISETGAATFPPLRGDCERGRVIASGTGGAPPLQGTRRGVHGGYSVSQLRAVRSLAVSGKASAACAGASIYGIGWGRPPAAGGRSGARSCCITGVGSMRRRGATRQEGEGGGLEVLPTHRVQHGLGTPSRRRNCEQAVPGCAELEPSASAETQSQEVAVRTPAAAGASRGVDMGRGRQMVCENQSRKKYQRIGFKVNKGPAAVVAVCRSASAVDQRPKGQLKVLFLSWKSSVEFSRREVIQEQWDVDVGGGPATPDLERRQHQTAETVYFGRTTGYLLNNDPKKSIKDDFYFSLKITLFGDLRDIGGLNTVLAVLGAKKNVDISPPSSKSDAILTNVVHIVVLTGGSDQLEIQAVSQRGSKFSFVSGISEDGPGRRANEIARSNWALALVIRRQPQKSSQTHNYVIYLVRARAAAAAGVVHVGRAQKQAGWMRMRGGVPASTIGAQVHGAEDRRKQAARTEGGEHADKLVVQKRRSGAGGVRGGQYDTRGAVRSWSCEQARGSWASRGAWQERIVLEHEQAYAKRSSASTPCTRVAEHRKSGSAAGKAGTMRMRHQGRAGDQARRALGAGALLGVGNAEHRKSGSATGKAGTMRADEAPRACGQPGQTSAKGGSTIGRDERVQGCGCSGMHRAAGSGSGTSTRHARQRASERGGCERRRAGVLRRDLLYVDHSMSFGVDGTASDRKHIPAGRIVEELRAWGGGKRGQEQERGKLGSAEEAEIWQLECRIGPVMVWYMAGLPGDGRVAEPASGGGGGRKAEVTFVTGAQKFREAPLGHGPLFSRRSNLMGCPLPETNPALPQSYNHSLRHIGPASRFLDGRRACAGYSNPSSSPRTSFVGGMITNAVGGSNGPIRYGPLVSSNSADPMDIKLQDSPAAEPGKDTNFLTMYTLNKHGSTSSADLHPDVVFGVYDR